MSNKLILLIVAAGLVAFSMAFFRTGKPEISGLERPVIKLSTFQQDIGTVGNQGAAPVKSRFKKTDTKKKPAATKRKPAARRKANTNKAKTNRVRNVRNRAVSGAKAASGLRGKSRNYNDDPESRNARMEEHRRRMEEARQRKRLARERRDYNDEMGIRQDMDGGGPALMDENMMEDSEMGLVAPGEMDMEDAPLE